VLILDGQQRILLRPANDQPRDVMDDVHGGEEVGSRGQRSAVSGQEE
jgi:hypothetical protein